MKRKGTNFDGMTLLALALAVILAAMLALAGMNGKG